ncbi:MAG: 2-octaprenyl-6-methoxyphenyl hydroxylase [Woeseiaceae bacterium]|nr:2-octaprenyl-6-methoxyphenyl hydroxylase [Woeseiaceae bacterium]
MVPVATTAGPDFDIIVAGGGMIGTSLAVALGPLGLSVAVIEPVPPNEAEQPSFDERSTALSRSSQRMFEAMGLWPDIVAGATSIQSIHVSEKGRFGFSHIDAAEQGVEALGYVVINRVLGEVLKDALSQLKNVRLYCPAKITAVSQSDDTVTVRLEAGQEYGREFDSLACRLLVAADGARSTVREMLGIGASSRDYGQQAITGNLLPEIRPENRAFERFTDTGPIALLPIADNRAAFIWMLPTDRARSVMELSDPSFTEALQQAFGFRLGSFSKVGRRAAYPLALTRANSLTARRGVLVGNAAHGLHPVAAQGFNLGLRDVAALCDCLLDAMNNAAAPGSDPGSPQVLESYAGWRHPDHSKVVQFTDGLVRLFGDQRWPLKFMRNAGMLGFDLIPGVRSLFARHTMGLAGRLPRLSRGVPLR